MAADVGNECLMWKWMTRFGTLTREKADEMAITVRPTAAVSGKYVRLYTYLDNRFADVIVLTFGQIEDVLGFALPTLAHQNAWWTLGETNVDGPRHSDAWTLAGRTATPNLKARTVVFERTPTVRPGRRSS